MLHIISCIVAIGTLSAAFFGIGRSSRSRKHKAARDAERFAAQTPNVVYLFAFARPHGYIQSSPASLAIETFLRLCKIPYVVTAVPIDDVSSYSPTGRVPMIELNGVQTCESHFIIQRIKEVFPEHVRANLAELTPMQAATMDLMRKTLGYSMKFAYYRLTLVDNPHVMFDKYRELLPSWMPLFVKKHLFGKHRQRTINNLNNEGFGDIDDVQYRTELQNDLKALEAHVVQTGGFAVTKDTPSEADAWLFAHLYQQRAVPLTEYDLLRTGVLDTYVHAVLAHAFPDHAALEAGTPGVYRHLVY